MKPFLAILCAGLLLAGCTAQEKAIVHELEDLPGVTCEVGSSGALTDCHPDTLEDSSVTGPPLN